MQLTKYQKRVASWALIGAVAGLLVWLLAPVLMPFLVAWVLAYVLNPLVDRLDGWFKGRMPRWLSVGIIEVVVILALIGVFMLVVPLFIAIPMPSPCRAITRKVCSRSCWAMKARASSSRWVKV